VVKVHLWAGLRRFTDGAQVVAVEGATVGAMLNAVARAHPALAPLLADASVTIDGQLTVSRMAPVGPDNDIWLIQRVKGG
jgi:sulfur-carrier protein